MLYTHNEVFVRDENLLHQVQIVINNGVVDLEVSQDGLPFTIAETFTVDTVKMIRLTGSKYRFVMSGDAQASIVSSYYKD